MQQCSVMTNTMVASWDVSALYTKTINVYSPRYTGAVVRVDPVYARASVHTAGLGAVLVVRLTVNAGESERTRTRIWRHILKQTAQVSSKWILSGLPILIPLGHCQGETHGVVFASNNLSNPFVPQNGQHKWLKYILLASKVYPHVLFFKVDESNCITH